MTSKNMKIALEILKDEIHGDMKAALAKMAPDYSMTWVYQDYDNKLFPKTRPDFNADMKKVYKIKGRRYDIKNVAEGKDVVMVELIESYPDSKTKKVYKTPLVLVLEFKNGKIRRGRHYCDPRLSLLELKAEHISQIYK